MSVMLLWAMQIASIHEMKQEFKKTVKWLEILHSLVPNDPGVHARLGAIYQAYVPWP